MKTQLLKFIPLAAFTAGLIVAQVYPPDQSSDLNPVPLIKIKAIVKTTPSPNILIGVYNFNFSKQLLSGYLHSTESLNDSELELASIKPISPIKKDIFLQSNKLIVSPILKNVQLKKIKRQYEIHY